MAKKIPAKKALAKSIGPAGPKGLDPKTLQAYVNLMKDNGLVELEWQDGTKRLHLKSANGSAFGGAAYQTFAPPQIQVASQPNQNVQASQATPASAKAPASTNLKPVASPFVGTFYRSATPGSSPFVKEGTNVKAGDVLCIVEAMKLMNEIEAEFNGVVKEILPQNGQPIEFGETLFMVEAHG